MTKFRQYFFHRVRDGNNPAGITVSKSDALPEGDFGITEYTWSSVTLWFVDSDKFTAYERQRAFLDFVGI